MIYILYISGSSQICLGQTSADRDCFHSDFPVCFLRNGGSKLFGSQIKFSATNSISATVILNLPSSSSGIGTFVLLKCVLCNKYK